MNLHVILEELSGLEIVHGIELEREIQEGKLHNGIGSVVQYIGKKRSFWRRFTVYVNFLPLP